MPVPAHTRVTFLGIYGTALAPVETWQFGLNLGYDETQRGFDQEQLDALALAASTVWEAAWRPETPSDQSLVGIKYSLVGDDGLVEKQANGAYKQGEWVGAIAGQGTPHMLPLQTSLCVSLQTARQGPAGKGRFFLPWPAEILTGADKRLSTSQAEAFAGYATKFVRDINTMSGGSSQVVVASSKGFLSTVTGVRIGRVPDTMRSRRGALAEGYFDAPVYPPVP